MGDDIVDNLALSVEQTMGTTDNVGDNQEDDTDTKTGAQPVVSQHQDRNAAEWMTSLETEKEKIELDIAGRMDLGLVTFGEVIRDLKPYLTGENLPEVAEALRLLVRLLNTVQAPLNRIDVHLLVEYFCERLTKSGDALNYRAGIRESAEALTALATMTEKRFPPDDASLIVNSVFVIDPKNGLRDQKGSTRVVLYELLVELMDVYKDNLVKNIGTENIVQGIVAMAEFEKDPSCLRILFGMYEDLGRNWGLSQDANLLIWESFSRYFPITLGGADRNRGFPTPDELRSLLLNCFISSDAYADKAFPRLLDMLDTNQDLSANVKKEVFNTMAACIDNYSLPIVFEWATKIWDSLKFEVWNGENEEFIEGALEVMHSLGQAISAREWDWDDENNDAARFLLGVLKECVERIVDSKRRYMSSTGRILYALATASSYTFSRVIKKTFPALLTLWADLNNNSEKTLLLDIFNRLLEARIDVEGEWAASLADRPPQGPASPIYSGQTQKTLSAVLSSFRERLVEQVYWQAMIKSISDSPDDVAFRISTIKGLVLLTKMPDLLLDYEQGTILSTLNKLAFESSQPREIHREAVVALQQVSIHDPVRFATITLPNFMSQLPRRAPKGWKIAEGNGVQRVVDSLQDLVEVACTTTCSDYFAGRPRDFPKHFVFNAFQNSLLEQALDILLDKEQEVYALVVLATMLQGLIQFDAALEKEDTAVVPSSDYPTHPYAWIVLRLYRSLAVVKETKNPDAGGAPTPYIGVNLEHDDTGMTHRLVNIVGKIAMVALRSRQTTPANNFVNPGAASQLSQIWSLFIENAPSEIGDTQMHLQNAPSDKHLANELSMALVAGVDRKEINRLGFDVGVVAQAMIDNALDMGSNNTPLARITSLHFLQLLVNKFGASSAKPECAPSAHRSQFARLPPLHSPHYYHHLEEPDCKETVAGIIQRLASPAYVCAPFPGSAEFKSRIYQALAYFTAAALARCDPSDQALVDIMIQQINNERHGHKVAQCFRILLAPSEILTKENSCIIRPLRQGRLYSYTVDKLIARWRHLISIEESGEDEKTSVLVALAGVLCHMDAEVYLDKSAELIPLILEGTNVQNDDATKIACINIIHNMIPAHPGVITSHLESVIDRMTDRTNNGYYTPSDSRPDTRSAALDVLSLLTKHVDAKDLLKTKARVMSELDIAVDDCSLIVREKAVDCKLKWFNLSHDS